MTIKTRVKHTAKPEAMSGRAAMPLRSVELFATLKQAAGIAADRKSRRIGGRVSPKLVELAKKRTGIRSDSDLIEAGLLTLATDDAFGGWLVAQAGRLDKDLDLGLWRSTRSSGPDAKSLATKPDLTGKHAC